MKAYCITLAFLPFLLQGCVVIPIPDRTEIAPHMTGQVRDQQTKEPVQGARVSFPSYDRKERRPLEKWSTLSDESGRFTLEAHSSTRLFVVMGVEGDMFPPTGYFGGIVIEHQGYRTTEILSMPTGQDMVVDLEKADHPDAPPVVLQKSAFTNEFIRHVALDWPWWLVRGVRETMEFEVLVARRLKSEGQDNLTRTFQCRVLSSSIKSFKPGTRFEFVLPEFPSDPMYNRMSYRLWNLGESDRVCLAIHKLKEPDFDSYSLVGSVSSVRRAGRNGSTPLAGNAEEKEENMAAIYEALYLSQEKEDYAGAESAYRAVLSRDLRPSTRDLATFNLGITLKVQKRYDDAIAVLQSILDSRVDSYDAGESVMEASIDYRYESCIQIADCYQRQGKFREALDYRILARDKYKYRTDCSSCAKYESDSERSIIKELTEKVATAK